MNSRIIRISFIFIGFIFIFFTPVLHAKNIKADYSVEFGIVGEIAKVHATLTSNSKVYTLDANVSAVGRIAKMVTDNLEERHISKGRVYKGILITDTYQMIKSYGEYSSTTIYRVNHKKKRVTRHYLKWEKGKKIIDDKVTLGYYGTDDMMTLFLNLSKHIKNKHQNKNYRFSVVGADRRNGRVDVTIPSKNALKQMRGLMGKEKKGDWHSKVIMHRQLYQSKKGELEVRIDKEDIVVKAVLKDLFFFGDVRINSFK